MSYQNEEMLMNKRLGDQLVERSDTLWIWFSLAVTDAEATPFISIRSF